MPGETSLVTLLRTLKISLHPGTFVFITLPHSSSDSLPIPISAIQLLFQEAEGVTLIVPLSVAEEHGYAYTFRSSMVTLAVHSSLEAVGFMSVISKALSDRGISVNPVSGFYHDHLFVPEERAEEVVSVLEGLARDAAQEEDKE